MLERIWLHSDDGNVMFAINRKNLGANMLETVHDRHAGRAAVLVGIGKANRDVETLLRHLTRRFDHMRRRRDFAILVKDESGTKGLTVVRLWILNAELHDRWANDINCLW